MALSDVLFEAREGILRYTEDAFYRQMYDEATIEWAEHIALLCDKMRKQLDALPATESQHGDKIGNSDSTVNP
jgi:hypothetical protein